MAIRKLSYDQHISLLQDVKINKYKHIDLYKKYSISKGAFNNYMRVAPQQYRNYKDKNLIHSFFDKIDTEAKAYFLGLLFADGNIRKTIANQHYICLTQNTKDRYIIEKFCKIVKTCTKITDVKTDNTSRSQFSSEQMYYSLYSYDLAPRSKFGRKIPKVIPKKYVHHFIRGIFDGDGCVSIIKNSNRIRLEFIASSFLLKYIMNFINIQRPIWKKGNVKYIQITRKEDIIHIYKIMYKNSTIYLKRKYNKFKVFSNTKN